MPDADNRAVIAELLDENRLLEEDVGELRKAQEQQQRQLNQVLEKSKQKDEALLECLGALLGYCNMLERNVVQPAVGSLRECLQSQYWEVANSRDDLVARMSGVSAPKQSKLVKLFGHFANPAAGQPASDELRQQVWERAKVDGFHDPESAYVVVARLVEEQDQLAMILKFCAQQLHTAQALQKEQQQAFRQGGSASPGVGSTNRTVHHQQRQMETLQQQNDNLKMEVKRLEALSSAAQREAQDGARHRQVNEEQVQGLMTDLQQLKDQNKTLAADFHLVIQEKNILTQQGESLESTVRQERSILNSKIESQQNAIAQLQHQVDTTAQRADAAERALQEAQRERQLLQQQLQALDAAHGAAQRKLEGAEVRALQLEQERGIVRRKFETVERALTQGATEKAALREEVDELRHRLSSGDPATAAAALDRAAREKLQQEREESARLRLEIERLHRDHAPGSRDAAGDEEVAALQRENAALRDERARLEQGAAASRSSEGELQARVRQLQEVAARLRAELEQVVHPQRHPGGGGGFTAVGSPGGGAGSAPLPTGAAPTDGMHGRITSFEMCINQLNSELGNVEGRINSLDSSAEQTSQQLAARLERERQQFEQERSECDNIVQRMADELELLIRENQQLKQHLPPQPLQSHTASPARWPGDAHASPPHPAPHPLGAPPPAPSPSPPQHRFPAAHGPPGGCGGWAPGGYAPPTSHG